MKKQRSLERNSLVDGDWSEEQRGMKRGQQQALTLFGGKTRSC